MPVHTVSCPECEATLKSAAPFPLGKPIKCPKCSAIFQLQEEEVVAKRRSPPPRPRDEEEDEEQVTARRPARRPRADDDEDEERVTGRRLGRGRRGPAEEEDYADEDDLPRRRRGRYDEEDEDDYDRPRRRKKGGKGLLLTLTIGGGVLLLGLFALAAWVWPGFLKGSNSGGDPSVDVPAGATFTSCKDILVYFPKDCTKVVGIDVAGLRKDALVANNLEEMFTKKFGDQYTGRLPPLTGALKKLTGKDFKDWCDYYLWANIGFGPRMAVLKSNVDLKVEDLAKEIKANKVQVQGKTVYKFFDPQGDFSTLYMPDSKVLVLANAFVNDTVLGTILNLNPGGSPALLTGDFQSGFTKAEKSHYWKIEDQKTKAADSQGRLRMLEALSRSRPSEQPESDLEKFLKKMKPLDEAMIEAKPTYEVTCVTVGTNEVAYASWAVCKDQASAEKMRGAAEEVFGNFTDEEVKKAATQDLPRGPVPNQQAEDTMIKEAKQNSKYISDKNMVAHTYRLPRTNFDATMKK
jgi:hypothetical protein